MTKLNRTLFFSFQGVELYFCSQCLARFKAHPHLSIDVHNTSFCINKNFIIRNYWDYDRAHWYAKNIWRVWAT